MRDGHEDVLAPYLMRGLRVARTIIVATIFVGLVLPSVAAAAESYRPPWLGVAVYLALAAVVAADAVMVARNRPWGRARWPVAIAVLSLSVIATAALPQAALITPAHQTLGFVGWLGLLLLADRNLRGLGLFLSLHIASTIIQLGLADRADAETLPMLATVLVAVTGFQLTVGLAGAALHRVADAATAAAERQAELQTAEAIAQHVHADREFRYERLRDGVVPLLRGIGEHRLSPADPNVQRQAAVEAARMRRLFAEDSDASDPLSAELTALIDIAERKGIVVRQSVRGRWAPLPTEARRALLDEIAAVLLTASHTARVTLGGSLGDVTVSVVADGPTRPNGLRRRENVQVSTTSEQDRVWVEARWSSQPRPAS